MANEYVPASKPLDLPLQKWAQRQAWRRNDLNREEDYYVPPTLVASSRNGRLDEKLSEYENEFLLQSRQIVFSQKRKKNDVAYKKIEVAIVAINGFQTVGAGNNGFADYASIAVLEKPVFSVDIAQRIYAATKPRQIFALVDESTLGVEYLRRTITEQNDIVRTNLQSIERRKERRDYVSRCLETKLLLSGETIYLNGWHDPNKDIKLERIVSIPLEVDENLVNGNSHKLATLIVHQIVNPIIHPAVEVSKKVVPVAPIAVVQKPYEYVYHRAWRTNPMLDLLDGKMPVVGTIIALLSFIGASAFFYHEFRKDEQEKITREESFKSLPKLDVDTSYQSDNSTSKYSTRIGSTVIPQTPTPIIAKIIPSQEITPNYEIIKPVIKKTLSDYVTDDDFRQKITKRVMYNILCLTNKSDLNKDSIPRRIEEDNWLIPRQLFSDSKTISETPSWYFFNNPIDLTFAFGAKKVTVFKTKERENLEKELYDLKSELFLKLGTDVGRSIVSYDSLKRFYVPRKLRENLIEFKISTPFVEEMTFYSPEFEYDPITDDLVKEKMTMDKLLSIRPSATTIFFPRSFSQSKFDVTKEYLSDEDAKFIGQELYRRFEWALKYGDPAAVNAFDKRNNMRDADMMLLRKTINVDKDTLMGEDLAEELEPQAFDLLGKQLGLNQTQLINLMGFYFNF